MVARLEYSCLHPQHQREGGLEDVLADVEEDEAVGGVGDVVRVFCRCGKTI